MATEPLVNLAGVATLHHSHLASRASLTCVEGADIVHALIRTSGVPDPLEFGRHVLPENRSPADCARQEGDGDNKLNERGRLGHSAAH